MHFFDHKLLMNEGVTYVLSSNYLCSMIGGYLNW